mmetsp:Transcript_270/g.561  ORF Transcript_270/g.561 Transcript_270/m.561 type:complete len:286 (+) Transcript_270:24-881(+)|eukprot:CAMPEP_0175129040 /NCGR_PEP_ID=MMETSP0087-20121206/5255_1 /TAXON_ID=136419 /ORGANISM="Unknown Unknown, Strain D1" /LENGTH=285 /DNA_ID=CAMNT_0016411153 /DNA_START=13 /DNA_END=870 /DNA_ORIENTATION=+
MAEQKDQKRDLYDVLGCSRDASPTDIKRAYRKAALRLHPDHNKSPDATVMFQKLSEAHQVLSDPKKREYYDKYGETDDDFTGGESYDQAYAHWRSVFPKITPEDIENYRKEYIGSELEIEDIIAAYNRCEGDMALVYECVPFASADSIQRIYDSLLKLLEENKVDKHWSKALKKSMKGLEKTLRKRESCEEAEANEEIRNLGLSASFGSAGNNSNGVPSDLAALITARQAKRETQQSSFLDDLASKYSKPAKNSKRKGSAKKIAEPSEEEFAAIQASIKKRKAKR